MKMIINEVVCTLIAIDFYLVYVAGKQKTMLRVSKFEGFFTIGMDLPLAIENVPSEVACGYLCLLDDTCKAFFYDNSTLLCKPEQQCRQNTSGLTTKKGARYYTKEGECREEEAIPSGATVTDVQVMPVDRNLSLMDASDYCIEKGKWIVTFSKTSTLLNMMQNVFMMEDAKPVYWTGNYYDLDRHLFCDDQETITGLCGLLLACDTCEPCLRRAACEEEHPSLCFYTE